MLDDDVLRRAAGIRHIKESLWDEGEEQDEKRRELIRGNWMRVCGVYMGWKTSEVILSLPPPNHLLFSFFSFFDGGWECLLTKEENLDDHFHSIYAERHQEDGR